jgi:hypothetical protein
VSGFTKKAVRQHHRRGVWGKAAPERLHIDGSLEHDENVRAVVRVEHLTIRAEVLRTERTAVPLSDDTAHMPVAERKGMCEITKITCVDADEQLPRARKATLHTCGVAWYIRNRATRRGPSGLSISVKGKLNT